MAGVIDILDRLAATLAAVMGPSELGEDAVQIVGRWNPAPNSPTSVDIYPGDPFRGQETAGFQDLDGEYIFTVRARVTTPDIDGAQDMLLNMMDDEHDLCVASALEMNNDLDGYVAQVVVDGNTGFRLFNDPPGEMLGCAWRVVVVNATS